MDVGGRVCGGPKKQAGRQAGRRLAGGTSSVSRPIAPSRAAAQRTIVADHGAQAVGGPLRHAAVQLGQVDLRDAGRGLGALVGEWVGCVPRHGGGGHPAARERPHTALQTGARPPGRLAAPETRLPGPASTHLVPHGAQRGGDARRLHLVALPHQLQREDAGRRRRQRLADRPQPAAAAWRGGASLEAARVVSQASHAAHLDRPSGTPRSLRLPGSTCHMAPLALPPTLEPGSPTSASQVLRCSSSSARSRAPKPGSPASRRLPRSANVGALWKNCGAAGCVGGAGWARWAAWEGWVPAGNPAAAAAATRPGASFPKPPQPNRRSAAAQPCAAAPACTAPPAWSSRTPRSTPPRPRAGQTRRRRRRRRRAAPPP